MSKPYEYDTCACGERKHKSSARCRRCHHNHIKVTAWAHKLALAAARGEVVVIVAEKKSDLVALGQALRACATLRRMARAA